MANVSLAIEVSTYFKAGTGGVSKVVGYESGSNRVARYQFTTPAAGASKISFSITGIELGGGNASSPLRFYIGTDAESHINAGQDSEYTGEITMSTDGGDYTATGEADIFLMPNTTYYLWMFPGSTTYGWFSWEHCKTVEIREAGLVQIDLGDATVVALPYIDYGTQWKQSVPNVDVTGEAFVICN